MEKIWIKNTKVLFAKLPQKLLKSLNCNSDEDAIRYISKLSIKDLIEFCEDLYFILLHSPNEFDENEYFSNLMKERQKGRAYRSSI